MKHGHTGVQAPFPTQIAPRAGARPQVARAEDSRPAMFMVVARDGRIDRVFGLDIGAADQVMRSSSMRELLALLDARTHDVAPNGAVHGVRAGDKRRRHEIGCLRIDVDEHHVFIDEREIRLTVMEMRLLAYLAEHSGRLCPREEIQKSVWGHTGPAVGRTLDVHIKRLRDKLAAAGPLLETVRGIGFRFAPGNAAADADIQHPVPEAGEIRRRSLPEFRRSPSQRDDLRRARI